MSGVSIGSGCHHGGQKRLLKTVANKCALSASISNPQHQIQPVGQHSSGARPVGLLSTYTMRRPTTLLKENELMLTVGVDGSALGNPGPAGWAWYINDDNWAAGGWDEATNNRGELTAIIKILEATRGTDHDLNILADSQYAINSITKWMPGRKKRGWKKADGKPVITQDLQIQLDNSTE